MILRPYQQIALDEIRRHYSAGRKKVLLKLPTGAGKTLIFCTVLKSVHEKGKSGIMVVRGKSLVDQASQRLDREQVPHGVMQANHWRCMPDERIQICSIDTLYRRKLTPKADLVVIDEAHLAASPSFLWLVENYPDAFFLPVTATPYAKRGLRHIADEMVSPISMLELIQQGYLVRPRYFIPSKVDLTGVEIDKKTHDYVTEQLVQRMDDAALFGDMIEAYQKFASGRPALCFAVSIEHSLHIVESFNKAGIRTVHIEAGTSQTERDEVVRQLENREIDVISNVGILTTGIDIPCASCIIMARPTQSYNLYIQILGRGTRTYEGKNDFIILDHAANIEQHGLIEIEKEVDLDGKLSKPRDFRVVICSGCYRAFDPLVSKECPECGLVSKNESKEASRNTTIDETIELTEIKNIEQLESMQIQAFIKKSLEKAVRRGYKAGWIFHQVKERFGESHAKANWSKIKKQLPAQT